MARKARTKAKSDVARLASDAKGGENDARLVVNLPERVHRAIKLRAVERGITIRHYILSLLEGDKLPMD